MLGYLKNKVQNRVRNWDGRYIGKSGKKILIKSVAQTLRSYAMSFFLLLLEITKDIERTLSKYWWGSNASDHSTIWMSWQRLSNHKTSGGMGFRDFRDFNLAMLGKQGWRFLTNPGSLVTSIFKARYFPDSNFLDAQLDNNPSYVWRSIWEAKDLLKSGVRWMVGTGNNISIVNQPWVQDDYNLYITSDSPAFEGNTIASLMNINDRSSDEGVIRDLFNERDQQVFFAHL